MQARPWMPYALVAPSVIFLGALFIVPLVQTIWLSVATEGGPSLANYRRMAGDLNFSAAIRNTFLLTLVVVPLQIALALLMATMVRQAGEGPRPRPLGLDHPPRRLGPRRRPRLARASCRTPATSTRPSTASGSSPAR